MAPKLTVRKLLESRYACDVDGFCFRTPWDIWGRWVAFTIIAIIVLLIAYLFSRQSNQRRHKHGLAPMYGTGWLSAKYSHPNHQQSNFTNHDNNHPPVPAYSPPRMPLSAGHQGSEITSHGNNGIQNESIELTQPKTSYQQPRTSEIIYEPPPGPPPKEVL
ncbi:hypothetical protein OnM2_070053 [Erysiphe neolycopersici]|uniref:Uncharacterized protein n=1 Tax=Erysiphe neolycopersici TaxID=212602 RepID=A0A420HKX0_9PEZI|nr:hypothetical protein OnM2_070053 [Erysiphe neolycopersici]